MFPEIARDIHHTLSAKINKLDDETQVIKIG
jgi:hypothetical protein